MEEIKFRGKRVDNGEWVCGYYVTYGWAGKQKPYIVPDYASDLYAFEVDPETVGQYTGLKDKNGVEIYEGDILEEEPWYYFEVVWDSEWAKFKLQWKTKGYQYPEWNRGIEMVVIGNIYENSDLLKED